MKRTWFEMLGSKVEMQKTVTWAFREHVRFTYAGRLAEAADFLATANAVAAELAALR